MDSGEDISYLADEYKAIIKPSAAGSMGHVSHDIDEVKKLLVTECEWSPRATEHLLHLSREYGSFILRNALALSLALEIEDGALGL